MDQAADGCRRNTVWQIILEELALRKGQTIALPWLYGDVGEGEYYFMGVFLMEKKRKAIFQSTEIVYNFLPSRMSHSGSLPAPPSPPSHHSI